MDVSELPIPFPNHPLPATLKKYGLSLPEWMELWKKHKGACHICGQVPSTGRLVIDHEHVKGWKKMPPERRKMYVRGLLCWTCNHYMVGRGVTAEKAFQAYYYLTSYQHRINGLLLAKDMTDGCDNKPSRTTNSSTNNHPEKPSAR